MGLKRTRRRPRAETSAPAPDVGDLRARVPGDDSNELVIRTTPDGRRYTYVSPSVRSILGYEPEELLAQGPLDGVHPDDLTRAKTTGDRFAAGGHWQTVLLRKRHADGHDVWLEARIGAVRDPVTGEVVETQSTARDVTMHVATERALRQRVGAEALIGDVSRALLTATATEIDAVIVGSLERAARFVGAERATLVMLSDDGEWAVRTHQWGTDPEFETTDARVPVASIPWLVEQCRVGEVVFARSLDDLPPAAHVERAAFERAGVRSIACVPITSGEHLTGGLAFNWRTREADDCAAALSTLGVLADVLVVELDRKQAEQALASSEARFRSLVQGTSESRPVIEHVIATRAYQPVFQPVVDLATRAVVGFEALTRFDDGTPPDVRFKEAAEMGIAVPLEHATVGAALNAAAQLPPDLFVSINASPALMLERETIAGALRNESRPVVLELTEREPVDDYGELARVIEGFGSVKLAVDDAGAGYASLRHILALRPSFIKLDITWVRDIENDTARQALVAGINHFATLTNCRIVAEGVETDAECDALRRLGIGFGQGYLFGRPAPVDAYQVAQRP